MDPLELFFSDFVTDDKDKDKKPRPARPPAMPEAFRSMQPTRSDATRVAPAAARRLISEQQVPTLSRGRNESSRTMQRRVEGEDRRRRQDQTLGRLEAGQVALRAGVGFVPGADEALSALETVRDVAGSAMGSERAKSNLPFSVAGLIPLGVPGGMGKARSLYTKAGKVNKTEARRLLSEMLTKPEGFSYIPKRGFLRVGEDKGIMVGAVPGQRGGGMIGELNEEKLVKFLEDNAETIRKNPDIAIGGWRNDDGFFLDLSEDAGTRERAAQLMRDRNEIAAFDISTADEIKNPHYKAPEPEPTIRSLEPASSALPRPEIQVGGGDIVYRWSDDAGTPVEISVTPQRDGSLFINSIGDGETDVNLLGEATGAGRVGASRLRAMQRFIEKDVARREGKAVTGWTGYHTSGAAPGRVVNVPSAAPTIRSLEPEPVAATPSRDFIPEQQPIEHYVGARTPQAKLDEARERMAEAFDPEGPYGNLAEAGRIIPGSAEWYDSRPIFEEAAEVAGDVGTDQVNEILNMMAASTARSEPRGNLRRGIMWSVLKRRGLLPSDLGTKELYPMPPGFGHFVQRTAHQPAVGSVVREGGLNPLVNPKPASFGGAGPLATGNLGLNWTPSTLDDVMSRLAIKYDPKLAPFFDIKTNPKTGAITAAPKRTFYAPLDAGFRDAAEKAAKAGRVPVPDSRLAPTAPYQAMGWMGESGSAGLGSIADIFRSLRDESAALWGVEPEEASRLLFQEQRPFLLPLDHILGGR